MKRRYLIAASVALLTVVGVTIAQQPPATRPSTNLTLPKPAAIERPPSDGVLLSIPLPEPKPEELPIEQLLEAVKNLRAQKAELEKREQAFMKVLTKKTNKVKEEIDGLNGTVTPVAPPAPVVPTTPSYNSSGIVPTVDQPTAPKVARQ
ncbi:unnamed protein product [Gemmata massiliana]|uniref:Uncharacterized protein n=1 Tax=Gemmata massiliana TaxID=1210884 RepID=A0A6P2D2B6_9BACT|nr:hypothetical protein [Gemmata massiliana]VTR94706.1 unnamed protein product [Gemmata massiliana]